MRRRLKRTFYAVLGVTVFLFSVTLIGALVPGSRARLLPEDAAIEIGLIAGPIHYDLLLPLTPEIRSRFAFANKDGVAVDNPRAGWLFAGWGAREFYRALVHIPTLMSLYEAKSDFNIIHTCNDWISQTLRAAGRPMGVWAPTTLSVRTSLWWFAP